MRYPVVRKAPKNDFEQIRLAKVLSVDPDGFARSDLDGMHERALLFQVLHSFDGCDLSDDEFTRRTLALLDIPGAATAADVLAYHQRYYAATPLPQHDTAGGSVEEADAMLEHRFTFAGDTHQLPDQIDWEANPGIPHWIHGLNRFEFLGTLVAAFRVTGERKYAAKAVALILAWIDDTDIADSFIPGPDPAVWERSVKSPYVWLSHLEPAFHLVAWGQALSTLLRDAPDLITPADWLRILKSVHDQLHWLEIVTPEGGHGNGLIAGCGCQLRALACFPGFHCRDALATLALDRITATLDIQVLPDGVQHELTPHYHFCVANELLLVTEALPYVPIDLPEKLATTLRAMLRYVRQTLTPDGLQVAFNDSDPDLGWWVRETLARPSARALLGADADAVLTSAVYPYAGVCVLRQGSDHGRDELYLAFDGGPYGNVHQHEDALSCWLSAYGRSFIVDPGRYLYDYSEGSYYQYLISTKAHSTIRIDDHDQQSRAHPERWVARAPLPLHWEISRHGMVTAGADYTLGYGLEQIPVHHARTIRFFPEPGFWVLEDQVTGDGAHLIESRFQFAPGTLIVEDGVIRTNYPDANLAVALIDGAWDDIRVEYGQHQPRAGWYAPRLNVIEPAPALALYARRTLPFRALLAFIPYRGTDVPWDMMTAIKGATA